MDTKQINHFKNKLEKEKQDLISKLQTIGRINPENPQDWEPIPGEQDDSPADTNDFADAISEYEENTALLKELETQLKDINDALKKIDEGKYGICEISGHEIEIDRLEANPSARTCKAHINN